MSDSEDDNYVTFGVPLDPLDEENFPRKKPVTIEDQYAYDAQGRRRFHGAFTGGFSAGYFNTVGTRDGWRPQQFKSSRSSKAGCITQRPEDFMDEEDTSEFGIAPKGIRATSDYADHGQRGLKRERIRDNDGPIPGTPVLKELLKPVKETVGIMLLKKMGWRPGQGVGSRVTKKEKAKIKRRNEKIRASQQQHGKAVSESSSENSDDDTENIMFAPDDYEPFRCNPKDNYFGIGYSGLDRRTILSGHVNLFDAPAFSVQDKNKKLSIHGQAFGVGAFEADDEDIYEREDMSRYDFTLGPERKKKSRWSEIDNSKNLEHNCVEGFLRAIQKLESKKFFQAPELPKDFVPVHAVRKSRFYPPIENVPRTQENGKRKDLTAADRARILEDTHSHNKLENQPNAVPSVASNIVTRTLNLHGKQQIEERRRLEGQQSKVVNSWMEKLSAHNFVKGGIVGIVDSSSENLKKLEDFKTSLAAEESQEITLVDESDEKSISEKKVAKPFLSDPDKQRRFEQYLEFAGKGEKSKLESIQPLSMTEWDREHERTEFEQAARLFFHSDDYVADKFTRASDSTHSSDISSAPHSQESEMKQAVKMKMFGKLTRERMEWKPASLVCKRFNIPEPKVGCAQPELQKKTAKFSIFDSLDWSNTTKFLKATDAVSSETIQTLDSRKETHLTNNLPIESKSEDIVSFDNHQDSEPISEKMRSFEATYEKVFGKGIQDSTVNKIDDVESLSRHIEDHADSEEGSELIDKTNNKVSKDQSEEKKDLFKAIFLSSSEDSDSEPEESVDSEAMKSILIGKVPSEVNVQRNTSPPRGIFAKVDLDSLIADTKRNERTENSVNSEEKNMDKGSNSPSLSVLAQNHERTDTSVMEILPDAYGPALPARLMKNEHSSTTEATGSQDMKPVFRSVVVPKIDSKLSGKWVERGKEKKSKKEKKKHKHKEHKSSKHKRKSKKEKRR